MLFPIRLSNLDNSLVKSSVISHIPQKYLLFWTFRAALFKALFLVLLVCFAELQQGAYLHLFVKIGLKVCSCHSNRVENLQMTQ